MKAFDDFGGFFGKRVAQIEGTYLPEWSRDLRWRISREKHPYNLLCNFYIIHNETGMLDAESTT